MSLTKEQLEKVHELSGDVVYLDGHIANLRKTLERQEKKRTTALAELRILLGVESSQAPRAQPMDHSLNHYDDMAKRFPRNPLPIWRTDIDPLYWPALLRKAPRGYSRRVGFLNQDGTRVKITDPESGGQKKILKLLAQQETVQGQFECLLLGALKSLDRCYDLFDHIAHRMGTTLGNSSKRIVPLPPAKREAWSLKHVRSALPTTEEVEAVILDSFDYLSEFFILVASTPHNQHLPTVETILRAHVEGVNHLHEAYQ